MSSRARTHSSGLYSHIPWETRLEMRGPALKYPGLHFHKGL